MNKPILNLKTIQLFLASRPWLQLAIALASGLLMGTTPAPTNLWFVAWVALVPLWVLLNAPLNRESLRFKWLLGFLWGVGYHGLALAWIRDLHPLTWMGVPWLASVAIALFAWSAIALWGGLLVGTWAWSLAFLCQRVGYSSSAWLRVLLGVALWCGLESIWSAGALWWTSLSFTQSPHNLAILHLGQISGPNTVVAAIVSINALLAEAYLAFQYPQNSKFKIQNSKSRTDVIHRGSTQQPTPNTQHLTYLAIALGLFISLHLIGVGLYLQPLADRPETALRVGIIQGNVPTRIKLFEDGIRRAIAAYSEGYRTLTEQGVDVVLTPESALPYYWIGANRARDPLYQAIADRKIPILLGTPGVQNGRITQSLFAIDGQGNAVGRYDKIRLVPLGEYIPFESVLGRFVNRLSPIDASMVLGEPNQQFDTPFGRAIAGICYDSAFARLFRNQAATGGQLIFTASNNDPYGAAMMTQHHAQDVMRAIESDRWAVRATNTGFSGIVDPHGRTIWMSGFRTYETYIANVYRRQTKTLYVRFGDWLTLLLLISGGAAWISYRNQTQHE
jgi:apolipoprotein N-acyltransferase